MPAMVTTSHASAKLCTAVSMQIGRLSFMTGVDLRRKCPIKANHFTESRAAMFVAMEMAIFSLLLKQLTVMKIFPFI